MKKTINLLPPELRRRVNVDVNKFLKPTAIIALVVMVTISCLLFVWTFLLDWWLKSTSNNLERIKPQIEQIQDYQDENKRLQIEISELEKVQNSKVKWAGILLDITEYVPQNMWIANFSYDQNGKIQIKGIAANLATVGVFLNQIEQLSYLSNLSLEKFSEVKLGSVSQVEFTLSGILAKRSE
ncbi:MAG: PilN domain-containing protein [Bacillota bacterium]|jgi:Tfp pilus assembly protein PilN